MAQDAFEKAFREEFAARIRAKKTPLFSTPKTIDEIIKSSGLKGEAVAALMMTVNTTLELAAQEIERDSS